MPPLTIRRFQIRRLVAATLSAACLASPAAALNLPFGLGDNERAGIETAPEAPAERPIRLSQNSDGVRMGQMEEEVRRLTGKVEELSFLVLQLQEQLRKNQEDNELRFQDLEGSRGGNTAAATPERRTETAPASPGSEKTETRVASAAADPGSPKVETLQVPDNATAAGVPAAASDDEIGALLNDGGAPEAASAPVSATSGKSDTIASIAANGPVEMYSLAYNYLLAGDYALAEQTFRQYAQAYPSSSDAPDAQYWLGESLYAQAKYRDAAEVFLNAQKSHPESAKAPEMMLKLGMSLARLDNKETACVTYAEVARRYPQMSANVKRKLQTEEGSANCG